ncbi:MAG TPA: HD domain-containing phosphohydrolase [Azospira sp.]|nr:HD domain-containing phosphohydrolase [Azospira sp.]
MRNINHIVITRLLLAWGLVSLLLGGGAWYLATERIDDAVVALAQAESAKFQASELEAAEMSPQELDFLRERTLGFVRDHFVVIELYDRQQRKVVEAVNPAHEDIEASLQGSTHTFPRDGRHHYEKFTILGNTVVQVLVPIWNKEKQISGFFEGVFLVSPEEEARLRQDLYLILGVVLAAVLITTVVLYPVIISLHRDLLRRSREILRGNLEMSSVLGAAIAQRDSDTSIHNYRVTLYACALGEAVGLEGDAMRALIIGAFLHDVGKIGISDTILLKPAKLTPEEFEVMQTHVALGIDIIAPSPWLNKAREVVEFHHEKYNGKGYLRGLQGEEIPLNARIFAIADVFDALASRRPYKEPMDCETALEIIAQDAGSHFDPRLAAAFAQVAPELHGRLAREDEAGVMALMNAKVEHYFFNGLLDS